MGVYLGPLNGVFGSIIDSFGGVGLLFMEDYATFSFLGSWVLVALY
jgi:hypothetical protein